MPSMIASEEGMVPMKYPPRRKFLDTFINIVRAFVSDSNA